MDKYQIVDGRIINRGCEVIVAEHCNLTCRMCRHLSPAMAKSFADPAQILRDLRALSRSYHVKVARLLGGEPLLHPDLISVIDAVRRSEVCDTVSVTTNGLLLPRMTDEFWTAVDAVQVSLYPNRSLTSKAQAACTDRARSHGVQIRFRAYNEFQESYSETGTDDADLVHRIFKTCTVAHRFRCHNVIEGWFYRCPQSYSIPKVLGRDLELQHADGILIEDTPSFRPRLLAYLQTAEVPRACSNCLGSSGRFRAHEQVRRSDFRSRQDAPTEELIHPRLVGPVRVALAKAEALVPRTITAPAEDALRSPSFVKVLRRAQATARAGLHIGDDARGGTLDAADGSKVDCMEG